MTFLSSCIIHTYDMHYYQNVYVLSVKHFALLLLSLCHCEILICRTSHLATYIQLHVDHQTEKMVGRWVRWSGLP